MKNRSVTRKITKILMQLIMIVSVAVLFVISASAATAYQVTKSGGALVRTSHAESASSVYRAAQGSIVWVETSKKNSAGNLWYKLTNGYWIYSGNVQKHICCLGVKIRSNPTCTSTGVKEYSCDMCGYKKTENTAALGHNYNKYKCSRCSSWNTGSLKSTSNLSNVKYYVKTDGAKVHNGPYGECDTVGYLSRGTIIYANQKVVNGAGNVWYRYSGGYVFEDYVQSHSSCSWGGATVTKSPTCSATGSKIQYCTLCGASKTSTVSALGHNYSKNVCTRCNGWKTSDLKMTKPLNNVKYYVVTDGAKVHNGPYGACKTIATLSKGTEIYVTQEIVNGQSKTWYKYSGGYVFSDYVKAHNSCSWGSYKTTKSPTCTSAGSKVRSCTVCGKQQTASISKSSHNYDKNVCTRCNGWKASSVKTSSVNNVKYYVITDTAKVHNGPYGACKTVGKLSKGKQITVTQKITNAEGNVWYKYSGGYVYSKYVKAHNSCSWGSYKTTKNAICTKEGSKTRTCSICGKKQTASIGKLGHKYEKNVCTRCNAWKASSVKTSSVNNVKYYVIADTAKVHNGPYGACKTVGKLSKGKQITVTQKITNAEGNVWYKYSGGYVYSKYVKSHASCSWNSGKTTKKATCTAAGTKVKSCTICGKTKTTTIAKLGHSYSKHVCTRCGAWKKSEIKSEALNSVRYIVIVDGSRVRSGPYTNCKIKKTLKKNTAVTVTEKIVNGDKKVWYKIADGYIYGENIKVDKSAIKTTLNAKSASLYIGKTKQLKATVKGPSNSVKWKSSNTSVASVSSSGKVTAKKVGSCTITATANGKSASCKITVKQLAVPASVKYTTLKAENTLRISHKAVSGAEGYQITYSDGVNTKTKNYTGTSRDVRFEFVKAKITCYVRAYYTVDGKKYYSKASAKSSVHVHSAKECNLTVTYKPIKDNYSHHTVYTSCVEKTSRKSNTCEYKEKHTFTCGVCQVCGQKQAASYVMGKIIPQVGNGPAYSSFEKNSEGKSPVYVAAEYSDSFFKGSSTQLNKKLCKLSAIGAAASYNEVYCEDFLTDCGFSDINKVFSGKLQSKKSSSRYDNDHARMIIGRKNINGKTVVAVMVNGYSEGAYEWISNFNVGASGYHTGFSQAANELNTLIEKYLNAQGINKSNVKFWLTGHSRGSAVMGMVAVKLNSSYGVKNVYAYGFATPNGVADDKTTEAANVFNTVIDGDFVPYVAPEEWGFRKFGETKTFAMDSTAKNSYKAMTGDIYSGLSKKERIVLCEAFCNYAPDRATYQNKNSLGMAIGLFQSDAEDKTEAYRIFVECLGNKALRVLFNVPEDYSGGITVEALMGLHGGATTKIAEAHCMETYIALVYSKYP